MNTTNVVARSARLARRLGDTLNGGFGTRHPEQMKDSKCTKDLRLATQPEIDGHDCDQVDEPVDAEHDLSRRFAAITLKRYSTVKIPVTERRE